MSHAIHSVFEGLWTRAGDWNTEPRGKWRSTFFSFGTLSLWGGPKCVSFDLWMYIWHKVRFFFWVEHWPEYGINFTKLKKLRCSIYIYAGNTKLRIELSIEFIVLKAHKERVLLPSYTRFLFELCNTCGLDAGFLFHSSYCVELWV